MPHEESPHAGLMTFLTGSTHMSVQACGVFHEVILCFGGYLPMQQLMLSAAAFPFTLAPDDTEGIQGQFALLVSVLDASGNQVEQLGQDSFHCFIHFAELDGLFAPPISQFEEFGRGLYRLIALGEGREGREPTAPLQVAIIVEQVDVKQEGPRQVQLEVIARGPGVVSAVHGKDYLP